jgi:hypothetical protein
MQATVTSAADGPSCALGDRFHKVCLEAADKRYRHLYREQVSVTSDLPP